MKDGAAAAHAKAVRRHQTQRLVAGILGQWGMGLVAQRLAMAIVDQLERAGFVKGL